jgi:hypothetical protein
MEKIDSEHSEESFVKIEKLKLKAGIERTTTVICCIGFLLCSLVFLAILFIGKKMYLGEWEKVSFGDPLPWVYLVFWVVVAIGALFTAYAISANKKSWLKKFVRKEVLEKWFPEILEQKPRIGSGADDTQMNGGHE